MRYNGIDPRTLHAGISISKEIPPGAPSSQLETLTGSTGEIVAGRTLKQAEYIVRVNIAARTRKEAWDIRAMLAAWAMSASEETFQLEPTHWPGRAYDAIFKEITPPEFVFGFAVVDVIFAIPRPIALGTDERTASGETAAQMAVTGTSYIHPHITVTIGDAYRAEIAVDGTVYAAVVYPFSAGDVLMVSTSPPSVMIISGSSAIAAERYVDYTVTDFDALCEKLTPGNHELSCAQGSGLSAAWREEYL